MCARACLALVLAAFGVACQERQPPAPASGPHACADFLSRTDFDVSVMDAELMNAGTETEHCWVDAMIRPNIRFGASLPSDWNGRFVMRGGGGYAGQQPVKGRIDPLRNQGYVTASTDTGHDAARFPLASFAYNNRDGEIDYAYRAVHLTAVAVKELIAEHYGRPADYDYWLGCSTGGRQGLMSAQRFPEDFDGILPRVEGALLAKIYGGVVSRGEPYFPGQPLGAEVGDHLGSPAARTSGWGRWFVDPAADAPLLERFGVTFMRYMAFERDDPDWELEQFDFTYHGWSDTALNPLMAVSYLRGRACGDVGHGRLLPPVHGARHVPLCGRTRHQPGGRVSGSGRVGGDRRGARPARGRARRPGR